MKFFAPSTKVQQAGSKHTGSGQEQKTKKTPKQQKQDEISHVTSPTMLYMGQNHCVLYSTHLQEEDCKQRGDTCSPEAGIQVLREKSLPQLYGTQGWEPRKPPWLLLRWAVCSMSHVQVCQASPKYIAPHSAVSLQSGRRQHPLSKLVNLIYRLMLNLQPFCTNILLKHFPCLSKGHKTCSIAWEHTCSQCCGGVGSGGAPSPSPSLLTGTSQQRGGEHPLHPFC